MPPHSPSQVKGRIAHHVTGEPTTVSRCLQKHFRLDENQVNELFALGAIYSNRKRVFEDSPLPKGAYLRIHLQPKKFPVRDIDWNSVCVKETEEFLIVNKPQGIPVHATLDNQRDNLLAQLRKKTGLPLLVTQRLDIPVGGLMLFAKNPGFQRRFNQWLVDRKVHKTYRALVEAVPAVGHHVHFMEPSERSPKRVSLEESPGWQRCELAVLSAAPFEDSVEVEVELYTGRTHQIRAQLSALGCPILGDKQYGAKGTREHGIALFSTRLAFPNPGHPPWEFKLTPSWK